jgi:hypothetical protein
MVFQFESIKIIFKFVFTYLKHSEKCNKVLFAEFEP